MWNILSQFKKQFETFIKSYDEWEHMLTTLTKLFQGNEVDLTGMLSNDVNFFGA